MHDPLLHSLFDRQTSPSNTDLNLVGDDDGDDDGNDVFVGDKVIVEGIIDTDGRVVGCTDTVGA